MPLPSSALPARSSSSQKQRREEGSDQWGEARPLAPKWNAARGRKKSTRVQISSGSLLAPFDGWNRTPLPLPARCPVLGYKMWSFQVYGIEASHLMLQRRDSPFNTCISLVNRHLIIVKILCNVDVVQCNIYSPSLLSLPLALRVHMKQRSR